MKLLLLAVITAFSFSAQAKELKLKNETIDLRAQSFLPIGLNPNSKAQYFIVQFENRIEKEDQKNLKSLGLQVLTYIPDDAYIVKGNVQNILKLKNANSRVYSAAPYLATWKLSNEFSNMSVFDSQAASFLSVRILPKTNVDAVVAKLKNVNVIAKEERHLILQGTKLSALEISALEGVEWIQELPQFETFDFKIKDDSLADDPNLGAPTTGYESGTKVMNFDKAWEKGYTGLGQMVAMADTGLDLGNINKIHADLKTVIGGEPVGLFGKSWEDPQGHGTHVTGSVVGQGTLSNGLIKGGAYNASYYAQGMWSPIFNNIAVPQDLKGMFSSAYAKGARVHTNSWGSAANLGGYDNYSASVDEFMFNNQDFLIIFAAGNSGVDTNKDGVIDGNSISSPGTAKNTLTVGASENYMPEFGRQKACGEMNGGNDKWGVEPVKSDKLSNNTNGIACFSSRGHTSDMRTKPEIVAPGTNIVSLRSFHPKATRLWGIYNENYSWAGGTSMATPLTAGAAAVARDYLVKKGFENPSSALMKATLIHTATDLFPGQFGTGKTQEIPTTRPNNVEGYGRVNMEAVTNLTTTKISDVKTGLATGESKSTSFEMSEKRAREGGTLRATLVYTDAAATTSAAKTLVNNLDLEVTSPTGKIFTKNDSINNSEMIEITDLSQGTYAVKVTGQNVPMGLSGKQPYALIISYVKNSNKIND